MESEVLKYIYDKKLKKEIVVLNDKGKYLLPPSDIICHVALFKSLILTKS